MKKLTNITMLLLCCLALVFSACNRDELPTEGDPQDSINSASPLSGLILGISQDSNSPNSIDCIDFVYPITFFVYDSNQEQTGSQTVNSDSELLQFLSGLNTNHSYSIQYPIEVILQDGTIVEVNSNSELQDLIEACESNGNQVPSNMDQIMTSGSWFVSYFFDDQDETSNYAGYEFTFSTDNTAQATNGSNTVNGIWSLTNGATPDLTLFFGTSSPFDELDEDWDIIEATQDIIRLKHISGGNGDIDFLTYERIPGGGGGGGGGGQGSGPLVDVLIDGDWYVTLMSDDGNDETCIYQPYEFTFNANQTVVAVSANNTVNGSWSVINDSGVFNLILDFDLSGPDDPFEELNDDWDVLAYNAQSINLSDVSGGNGGTDYLNFGRQPVTNCGGGGGGGGGGAPLGDVLVDGQWYVQSYVDDGDDQTAIYQGYTLTFNTNGTVVAVNGSTTISGSWEVIGDPTELQLELDFNSQVPFDEFNDDWDVGNYTDVLVELFDISGGNGGTDYLTFAKL